MTASSINSTRKTVLKLKHVTAQTGVSRTGVYAKLDKKSKSYDSTFPAQVKLGARSVGWLAEEVEAWITSRIDASRN